MSGWTANIRLRWDKDSVHRDLIRDLIQRFMQEQSVLAYCYLHVHKHSHSHTQTYMQTHLSFVLWVFLLKERCRYSLADIRRLCVRWKFKIYFPLFEKNFITSLKKVDDLFCQSPNLCICNYLWDIIFGTTIFRVIIFGSSSLGPPSLGVSSLGPSSLGPSS